MIEVDSDFKVINEVLDSQINDLFDDDPLKLF